MITFTETGFIAVFPAAGSTFWPLTIYSVYVYDAIQ